MTNIDFSSGFKTTGQYPLNGKTQFKTLVELKDLGVNNSNAFKYQEDMKVNCIETHKEYMWRENINQEQGILDTDFSYPQGAIADGINYEGRDFNFFEVTSSDTVNQDNKTIVIDLGDVEYEYRLTERGVEEFKEEAIVEVINNLNPPIQVREDENLYIKINLIPQGTLGGPGESGGPIA